MKKSLIYHALPSILDRDLSIISSTALLDKYGPYLQDIVNCSTHLLVRCEKSLSGVDGTPSSLIHLYYHSIQIADGIEALASQGCFAATAPLFRSLHESTLSIEFMLQEKFELRSTAWMVGSLLERKRFVETIDESTDRGRLFREQVKSDRFFGPTFNFESGTKDLAAQLEAYERVLRKPKFRDITAQFEKPRGIRYWYQIDQGPKDFFELSKCLRRPSEYVIYYRHASESTHGRNSEQAIEQYDGVPVMAPIRSIDESKSTIYLMTAVWLIQSSLLMSGKLRPEEKYSEELRRIFEQHRIEANR